MKENESLPVNCKALILLDSHRDHWTATESEINKFIQCLVKS